jgi:hypothetical protein
MQKMGRREFLGATLVVAAAAAYGEEAVQPLAPSEAEWKAIQWGKPVDGLEAGLRLVRPKTAYLVGDHVELALYLRNQSEKPVAFTYYPAFWEQTVTILDAAGERLFVSGVAFLGLPTSVRLTLAEGETLSINHPGFWFDESKRTDRLVPHVDKPVPGILRVSQEVGFSVTPDGRKALENKGKISTTPLVILSADRKPRRIQAEVVGSTQEDLTPRLKSGEITVTLARS